MPRQPNSLDFLKTVGRALIDSYDEESNAETIGKRTFFKVAKQLRTHLDAEEAKEHEAKPHQGGQIDDTTTVVGEGKEV